MADVAAKDGSQETLVNLSALLVSVTFLPYVSGKTTLIWVLFSLLTLCHLYANYRAVRSLKFKSINHGRLRAILTFVIFQTNFLSEVYIWYFVISAHF